MSEWYDEVNKSVDGVYADVWASNGTMRFWYIMENPENPDVVANETALLLIRYAEQAQLYIEDSPLNFDETYVPERLEVYAVEPKNQELYHYGHVEKETMNKYRTDQYDYAEYHIAYASTVEHGPGKEHYED